MFSEHRKMILQEFTPNAHLRNYPRRNTHAANTSSRPSGDRALRIAALAALVFVGGVTLSGGIAAQAFPSKPVRFVVPYPPGGAVDTVARMIGQKLSEAWGHSVVVDNRPGGATNIGTELVARAAPDGYTLLMGTTANTVNATLYPKLPFDFVRDFAPVTLVDTFSNVLVVHASLPTKSVKELIAFAKARPGQVNYASAGVASSNHLSAELFNIMAGINITHVPYKGAGPALNDLLGGRVTLFFSSVTAALPHVETGKLRALGVTGSRRTVAAPNIPTIAEEGLPGYDVTPWHGVLAPARTPNVIIAKLHADIAKILEIPEVRTRLAAQGIDVIGGSPAELSKFIKNEIAQYAKLIKAAGIKVE